MKKYKQRTGSSGLFPKRGPDFDMKQLIPKITSDEAEKIYDETKMMIADILYQSGDVPKKPSLAAPMQNTLRERIPFNPIYEDFLKSLFRDGFGDEFSQNFIVTERFWLLLGRIFSYTKQSLSLHRGAKPSNDQTEGLRMIDQAFLEYIFAEYPEYVQSLKKRFQTDLLVKMDLRVRSLKVILGIVEQFLRSHK